jgi:hypothetical protein
MWFHWLDRPAGSGLMFAQTNRRPFVDTLRSHFIVIDDHKRTTFPTTLNNFSAFGLVSSSQDFHIDE